MRQRKYHPCPWHLEQGILVVDAETEMRPQTDADGNRLYYCPSPPHVFPAREDTLSGLLAPGKQPDRRGKKQ